MTHPMIARRLAELEARFFELEAEFYDLEEGAPEEAELDAELVRISMEIRGLELAATDPEAHGFQYDSPSLPEPYPY